MVGLDLARAIAVVCVLQVHFGILALQVYGIPLPPVMAMVGSLGVELFFALSGFLIGGLLLEVGERSPTVRGWLRFLVRRWMRTIPLYVLWIAVIIALAKPMGYQFRDPLAYLTFTQNLTRPIPVDGMFPVSWSLTIEEWFYLLFSAMLLGIASIRPRAAVLLSCSAFILLPLLLRFGLDHATHAHEGVRTIAICRLDAIAYGTVLAFLFRNYPQKVLRLRFILLAAGLALTSLAALLHPSVDPALTFTLYPLAMAMCLPAAAALASLPVKAEIAVRWLSTRSYGLYLIHLTVIQVALAIGRIIHLPTMIALSGALGGSLLAADLIHRYFERPIMARRPRQFPPSGRDRTLSSMLSALGRGIPALRPMPPKMPLRTDSSENLVDLKM